MLCRKACIGSAKSRCRLNKLSSSSKSKRTGKFTLAMRRLIVSVPGGAFVADGPSTATPASPASWRAMSIHGVSRPGCGSQALPTNTATFALGASVNPASLKRSLTPGASSQRSEKQGGDGLTLLEPLDHWREDPWRYIGT